jgi:VIT1/CCC1 family predicted Fe2+/Mn2+ transporter
MQRSSMLQRCRRATWKTWLGAALTVWLLLAESFAIAHQYDSAAHANGQDCAICVGAASFGAATPATPLVFALEALAAAFVAAVVIVFVSAAPVRRYARGPPAVSFTF